MDPVTLLVIPGFLGGACFALVLARLNRHARAPIRTADGDPISTDVINISRIRVAGIGGLGLVAMAVVVAIAIPGIGRSLAVGLLLGLVLAATLIVIRRKAGPLQSSSAHAGANTTFAIDDDPARRS